MTITKEDVLEMAKNKGKLLTSDLVSRFSVSRQYVNRLIKILVGSGKIIKIGRTRHAFYILPEYAEHHPEVLPMRYRKTFENIDIEEHKILMDIEQNFLMVKKLPENVRSIFTYAFSEMLNNAIEHSESKKIKVDVSMTDKILTFIVEDFGIGVFRNIMRKKELNSPLEAIQDLLKGKTTTMPKSHSGEGIFFTSKSGDLFILDSFGDELTINNDIDDIFVKKVKRLKRGTRVIFKIKTESRQHLNSVFKKYTDISKDSDYGFDKTEIHIKLYAMGGVHISRSQARRILSGLEKFKIIMFDFDKVPVVGQAFADEIFRVFHNKYPKILLQTKNMDEGVEFMVGRAKNNLVT